MKRQVVKLINYIAMAAVLYLPTAVSAAEPWVEAARKREEAFRTMEIEFHLVEFHAKGSHPALPIPGAKSGALPPTDQTVESTNRLVIDDNKVRYENNRPVLNMIDGKFIVKEMISAANGGQGKLYYPEGVGRGSQRKGIIMRTADAEGTKRL